MTLQIKRGSTANLPSTAADGELLFATDTNKLYVGNNGAPQEVTGSSASELDELSDVVISSPSTGQVLKYNGTAWVNGTDVGTDVDNIELSMLGDTAISDPTPGQVLKWNGMNWSNSTDSTGGGGGAAQLDELTDVTISSPSTGQVLKYNGSSWVNSTDSGGSGPVDDLVADTALIGNVSIIESTISAVDDYGAASELTFDGDVTVTGTLTASTTLTLNADGSKSVSIDGVSTTAVAGASWMQASWPSTMYPQADRKTIKISSPSQSVRTALGALVPGDTVTFGGGGDFSTTYYTFTIETAGFNLDPMYGVYTLYVVEESNNDSTTYFSASKGLTITSGSAVNYDFSEDALTAPAVIAETAILGDVTIVGNTISAVDAAGYTTGADLEIASNLVLEGDLTVSGQLGTPMNTSTPAAYTVVKHKAADGTVTSYYMPLYQ